MSYVIVGGAGFLAGVILSSLFLNKAIGELKDLVSEAHAKLDTIAATLKVLKAKL